MTVRIKGESMYSLVLGKALHLKTSRRFPTSRHLQFSGAACVCVCVCVRAPSCFSHVRFFETPQTIAPRAPLPWILEARTLEWVATSSSRGSSPPRDRTCISADGFFTTSTTWDALSGADSTITWAVEIVAGAGAGLTPFLAVVTTGSEQQ